MPKNTKEFFKNLILFIIGGFLYCVVEMLYRGRTHWTMAVIGGLCFIVIGGLNNYLPWKMTIWKQGIIGALFVTAMEFVAGIPLNLFLKLDIWNYSNIPFNILGQVCLPFTIAWFFLSLVCIFIDDWLRHILFKEETPDYCTKEEQPVEIQNVPESKIVGEPLKNIVDISYAQGKITDEQWKYFKENLTGIIIRFGYRGYGSGTLKIDKCIDYNIFKCNQFGIPYGLYFFSQAINSQEGKQEANMILKSEYSQKATLGIWFDTELANNGDGRADNLSVKLRTEAAKGFCDTIISVGKKAGIYASSSWLKNNLDTTQLPYPIWVAHYAPDYSYKDNVVLWQYSSSNPMGIPGFEKLDCNKIIDKSFFDETRPKPTQAKSKKDYIKAIQSALGVTADGISGPKTIAATVTISQTKNYMHPAVKPLQDYLNYLGYNCGTADGIAGVKFDVAVKQFQKDNGCVVDGELTAQKTTWKKLLTI